MYRERKKGWGRFVCLSVKGHICLSAHLCVSVCLSVCLSICLSAFANTKLHTNVFDFLQALLFLLSSLYSARSLCKLTEMTRAPASWTTASSVHAITRRVVSTVISTLGVLHANRTTISQLVLP